MKEYVDKEQLFDLIYPIDSVYISVNSTSPQTLFGGVWEQLQDRFLIGAGGTYAAGTTGGEENHTLTVDEIPNHNHRLKVSSWSGTPPSNIAYILQDHAVPSDSIGAAYRDMHTIEATGGGAAHNNMPPYLAVYMWKRTA